MGRHSLKAKFDLGKGHLLVSYRGIFIELIDTEDLIKVSETKVIYKSTDDYSNKLTFEGDPQRVVCEYDDCNQYRTIRLEFI